jgi:hypothetical protein
MSGAFGSSQWMYSSGAAGFYPYSIAQSLRVQNGVSQNLTVSSAFPAATDRKKVTISFWYKRALNSTNAEAVYRVSSSGLLIRFNTDGTMYLYDSGAGWQVTSAASDRLFRDPAAYYHFALILDSSQSTASDRAKFYINGDLWSLSTWSVGSGNSRYPTLNANFNAHNGSSTTVLTTGTSGLNGYVAEFLSIDGQDVTIDDLGETLNGVWVAKEYQGSFGNAGFHLDFADNSAIGNDVSGNNVDFTADAGFGAHDVVPDSPSGNNFATLNVNFPHVSMTFSEGNLKWSSTGNNIGAMGNFAIPIGTGQKYYFEYVQNGWGGSSGDDAFIGLNVDTVNIVGTRGGYTSSYSYGANQGNKRIAGSETSYGTAWGTGDVIGIAVDRENNTINFAKNNTFHGTFAIPATGNLFAWIGSGGGTGNANGVFNFGQDSSFANTKSSGSSNATDDNGIGDFYYTPPSGFLALCTANLLEPTIGANSAEQADDYFNTVLYTANNNVAQSITGVGFQPDWLWIKERSTAEHHVVFDVVRGNTQTLLTSSTNVENTNASAVTSFDSDGFSLGTDGAQIVNYLSETYVAWNWKAGGTAVSNTDGSITSQVSAAPDAGFAVGTFSGTGANATIGHGLSIAPEMIIVKSRTQSGSQWPVYHKYIASDAETDHLFLNGTDAAGDAATYWNDTAPTASVFSVGTAQNTNKSGEDLVFYAFHSVPGYQSIGSYVGNGSADGTFVFTGHRVKWLMVKNIDNAAASWWIMDTERSTFNVMNDFLFPNSSAAESASTVLFADFLSNGFKIRNGTYGETNASGNKYIFLSFGDSFKYANAR